MQRIITQLILVSSLLAAFAPRAQAQSAEPDQQLRATVLRLIDSLVDAGVLTRTKADELIRAAATTSGVTAVAQAPSAGPEVGADGKRIVRVPYVPESLKREMRDSIRQDVLTQARTERWGEAGALPDWLSRISIDGDIRVRADATGLSKDNTNARDLAGNALVTGLTRAADPRARRQDCVTFPSLAPVFALDRFYLRGLTCRSTLVPRGVSWARMSDHLPLVAELHAV
jgi:hypothetical protein